MVRISRASRRRAERERKKREKKQESKKKHTARKQKKSDTHSAKTLEPPKPRSMPWDEESPKCPDCASDWVDEGALYSCFNCGRFCMKTDLGITDCERCKRPFLWETLESWTDFVDNDNDDCVEHLLCSDCLTAVFVHGDVEWLNKT